MIIARTAHYKIEKHPCGHGEIYYIVYGIGCYEQLWSLDGAVKLANRCEKEFYEAGKHRMNLEQKVLKFVLLNRANDCLVPQKSALIADMRRWTREWNFKESEMDKWIDALKADLCKRNSPVAQIARSWH